MFDLTQDEPLSENDLLKIVAVLIVITYGFTFPLIRSHWMRLIEKAPTAGLYEGGLQVDHLVFIPYEEIARVERVRVWRREPDHLTLHLKVDNTGRGPFRVSIEFLGEEGVRELKTRVHANGSGE